ncbi:hypothetical protein QBC39DRAFT_59071 [Podospora conica]|nr:hypothetical protein QBC39DRAFT_59071 [Schizothecium conicum]
MRALLRTLPPRPLVAAAKRPLFTATQPRRQDDPAGSKEAAATPETSPAAAAAAPTPSEAPTQDTTTTSPDALPIIRKVPYVPRPGTEKHTRDPGSGAPIAPSTPPPNKAVLPPPLAVLSVGTDICHVPRIQKQLDERGLRFATRVLTDMEIQGAIRKGLLRFPPAALTAGEKITLRGPRTAAAGAKYMAGRWAAKEAVKKAFPHRHLGWHDVVIEKKGEEEDLGGRSGPPVALVRDGNGGWEEVPVSISHDGEYATATCIGSRPAGGVVRPVGGVVRPAGGVVRPAGEAGGLGTRGKKVWGDEPVWNKRGEKGGEKKDVEEVKEVEEAKDVGEAKDQ